jgi:hypothetical protein
MVALAAAVVMAAVAVMVILAAMAVVALGVTPVVAPGATAMLPFVPQYPAVLVAPPEEVPVVVAVLRFIVSAMTFFISAAVVAGVAAQV